MNELIDLHDLGKTPATSLLTYPYEESEEIEARLRELIELGVTQLELRGRHTIKGIQVLGKGHVGVVVAARYKEKPVALKIRRLDADRKTLKEEAAKMKARADREVTEILSEAYKQSQIIKGQGDQKALKIYSEAYGKDKEFFKFTKSMETYKDILNRKSTLILSTDSDLLKYLNNPQVRNQE